MPLPPVPAAAIALLPLLAVLGACAPPPATAASGDPRLAAAVVRAEFQPRLILTGELQAVRAQPITIPRTPAWEVPIRWLADDGATVVRGQKIVELDNSQFTGDLEQKRLAANGAYNDLARKRVDVRVALGEKDFEVERRRIALEKARIEAEVPAELVSARQYQDRQLALVRADFEQRKAIEDRDSTARASEAEIAELAIGLARTRSEIVVAEEAIAALALQAPGDGILVIAENPGEGRKFQVGDSVWVGLPVAQIPDLSEMDVVARLYDVDDGRIATGMLARCRIDAYPEQEIEGHVIEISPVAQEHERQSLRRSFKVVIRLAQSDPEHMRPGMSVRAEVLPPPVASVLVVPRTALVVEEGGARALLADGSTVPVRLGPCDAQQCVVEEGIAEGTPLGGRT